jgi:hypothetical protein
MSKFEFPKYTRKTWYVIFAIIAALLLTAYLYVKYCPYHLRKSGKGNTNAELQALLNSKNAQNVETFSPLQQGSTLHFNPPTGDYQDHTVGGECHTAKYWDCMGSTGDADDCKKYADYNCSEPPTMQTSRNIDSNMDPREHIPSTGEHTNSMKPFKPIAHIRRRIDNVWGASNNMQVVENALDVNTGEPVAACENQELCNRF